LLGLTPSFFLQPEEPQWQSWSAPNWTNLLNLLDWTEYRFWRIEQKKKSFSKNAYCVSKKDSTIIKEWNKSGSKHSYW
jgi:hypothetical protein